MSYIVNDGADRPRSRRPLIVAGVSMVVVALVVTAFLIGQGSDDQTDSGVALPTIGRSITWSTVGDQPVPSSATHGPFRSANGLAAGFSHDELGAAFAAVNLSARLSSAAGPVVFETTARQQTVGDIEATLAALRNQRSSSVAGSTVPSEILYRITSGSPTGDLVAVSIAFTTPQATTMGGYGEISRILQWVEGDWKIQVPPAPPRLITSVEGYTSLGGPDA